MKWGRQFHISALSIWLIYGAASCSPSLSATTTHVAQRFLAAAAAKDSAALQALISNRLVLGDLRRVESNAPGLVAKAAEGLKVDRVSRFADDSVYLYAHPTAGTSEGANRGLDIGLNLQGEGWRVYYVGLTGTDLSLPEPRSRERG